MPALSKAALLALKPKIAAVPVPELGEDAELYIAEMDALSVFEFGVMFRDLAQHGDNPDIQPKHLETMNRLLERTLVDEDGNALFEAGEFAQVRMPFVVRQRLFDKALELSGMKGKEDTEKNSEPTQPASLHAA